MNKLNEIDGLKVYIQSIEERLGNLTSKFDNNFPNEYLQGSEGEEYASPPT